MKRINPTPNLQQQNAKKAAENKVTSVVLDSSMAIKINKGNGMVQERSLMRSNTVWHKCTIIRGAHFDKELILRSILQAVSPNDLIPVRYTVSGDDSSFLVRNCESSLHQLCSKNLIIKSINGDVLLLKFTLGFASIHDLKLNIRPLLLALLTKRYIHRRKALILDNFHRDSEITTTVYCPLSQHRTLTSVLNIAAKDLPPIEYLSLQGNDLSSLVGMENSTLKNVKSMDLRKNNILNAEVLSVLKSHEISELWLDENPLCENFSSPQRYIESVRMYCPSLSRLDGIYIGLPGLPIISKMFVKSPTKQRLIVQFLEHFFTLFDDKDRGILKGLYHPKAVYSMTVDTSFARPAKQIHHSDMRCIADVTKEEREELQRNVPAVMAHENRNLLNKTKDCLKFLHCGEEAVLAALKKLPETQHFMEWFSYDLIYDDGDCLVIGVDGIFRDKYDEKFLFNRTFVLAACNENEYIILNDQNLIYCTSAKDLQLEEQFPPKKYVDEMNMGLTCLSIGEKEELVSKLKKVTTMNDKFCRRFLNEADWDIRKAIIDFTLQYKAMCIPDRAFPK